MNTTADHAPEIDSAAPQRDRPRAPGWTAPAAGLLAGAVAVTVGTLVAALIDVDAPLSTVGSEFIDHTPKWLKSLAIDWFGTNDKQALRAGMYLTVAVLALVVGWVARRRPWLGVAAFAGFGVLGAVIAVGRPNGSASWAVPPLLGAAAGAVALWALIRIVRANDAPSEVPGLWRSRDGWDRRQFVAVSGGAAVVAVVAGVTGRGIERRRVDEVVSAAPTELPQPTGSTVPSGPTGAPVEPAGATLSPITPYFTPNSDFYLIDTALSVPRVNVDKWSLTIDGRVDRPLRLTYADLLAREQVERIVTLCCVSNEVGGDLIGNAVWQGVLLAPLLEEVGVQTDAQQVFATSVDGWTCGFPVEVARDGRDAMIAVGMNGEPLPRKHGFPARMVVPGLYGYVSATKWIERIQLTTWDEAEGYWVPRGWARDAPVKTQSRIDVPRRGDDLQAGTVVVAGIAWAQHRGISKVEVRVDDEPWQQATLATDVTVDSWRQWRYEWQATPGDHRLQVRATDGNGDTQIEQVSRPDPDGATGWHTRRVTVS